jgi:hypothetical protein
MHLQLINFDAVIFSCKLLRAEPYECVFLIRLNSSNHSKTNLKIPKHCEEERNASKTRKTRSKRSHYRKDGRKGQ